MNPFALNFMAANLPKIKIWSFGSVNPSWVGVISVPAKVTSCALYLTPSLETNIPQATPNLTQTLQAAFVEAEETVQNLEFQGNIAFQQAYANGERKHNNY